MSSMKASQSKFLNCLDSVIFGSAFSVKVERLTNMQLKLDLRQQTAKLYGNKALLIERVLNKHADGTFETILKDIMGKMTKACLKKP